MHPIRPPSIAWFATALANEPEAPRRYANTFSSASEIRKPYQTNEGHSLEFCERAAADLKDIAHFALLTVRQRTQNSFLYFVHGSPCLKTSQSETPRR
jgi:hypothetical protein